MKETFFSESTEKEAKTSASVLLFGTTGPLLTGAVPFGGAADWAALVAFFALNSSAHDFGAAGFGGEALGVSSALACANSG